MVRATDPAGRERVHLERPLRDLQHALDIDDLWQASRGLLAKLLPHHSCSLMLNIRGYQPQTARHHVVQTRRPGYVPATSLSVSRPFLEAHRDIRFYTYSQIVSEDPLAEERRAAQEHGQIEWIDFVHLAFWRDHEPQAVLSIRRAPDHPKFTQGELRALQQIYPLLEAGVLRIRTLEEQREKVLGYEHFLQSTRLPVMFLDADSRIVFASREACVMCARWHHERAARGNLDVERRAQLPQEIADTLQGGVRYGTSGRQVNRAGTMRWQVTHPVSPGFSAQVEMRWLTSLAGPRPAYIVTFSCANKAGTRAQDHPPAAQMVLQQLTPRERRVALLVAEGLRNNEIARRLCRSLRTVEFQLSSIYQKLDLSSRTQLLRLLT